MQKFVDSIDNPPASNAGNFRENGRPSRGWVFIVLALIMAALACNLPEGIPPLDASPTAPQTAAVEIPAVAGTATLLEQVPPVATATEEPPEQPLPGVLPTLEPNLATGKQAYASNEQAEFPASFAVDGSLNNMWNSGGQAPQWIEIDLGGPAVISAVRLYVSQFPEGNTEHELTVSRDGSYYQAVHTFSGPTGDGLTLDFTPDTPLEGYRYLRVRTILSPSWVAWKEIELVGTFE